MSTVDDDRCDVLMIQGELQKRQGFRFGELVAACTIRMVLIAMHEVHVQVDAPGRILVVPAILIIVMALAEQVEVRTFSFFSIRLPVEAAVIRVGDEVGLAGIMYPHHRDESVSVEIIGSILVTRSITVRVITPHVSSVGVTRRIGDVPFMAIRIEPRHDVEGVGFEKGDDVFVTIGSTLKERSCDFDCAPGCMWPGGIDACNDQQSWSLARFD